MMKYPWETWMGRGWAQRNYGMKCKVVWGKQKSRDTGRGYDGEPDYLHPPITNFLDLPPGCRCRDRCAAHGCLGQVAPW